MAGKEAYFLIQATEDGIYLRAHTKERLAEALTNGELKIADRKTLNDKGRLEDLQQQSGWYLIKGEQVVPKPVEHVTTWEI
jgi:glucokinase